MGADGVWHNTMLRHRCNNGATRALEVPVTDHCVYVTPLRKIRLQDAVLRLIPAASEAEGAHSEQRERQSQCFQFVSAAQQPCAAALAAYDSVGERNVAGVELVHEHPPHGHIAARQVKSVFHALQRRPRRKNDVFPVHCVYDSLIAPIAPVEYVRTDAGGGQVTMPEVKRASRVV